ncbi:malto-oligosyltrehalose trehalohydrolase [Mucilaginibacter sp. L3T2-6]|uniref:malto-oligosyltrehalose trehalohydrolase n=1 Tax=Mucilaginibacter sp. L3T2-6 TaxID=3062491 RepID=UPI0026760E06|nr:malto-oligosyltrehalose trehalohydrolase [Mucilaginibacter sp. L3T2-6]MDO3643686.1 malto-oligosyltrehalose trehalohydrolase [Mucilaginibacter sp. L3T2-6]MDV6216066.1 malto-oligosyltrehalose trehalohydrolase [Mucilaginibacter sp. L3T2-6]
MQNKLTPGIVFEDGLAKIAVWAPFCKKAEMIVNDRTLALQKQEFGYWMLESNEIKPGDRYQFDIDGKHLPDPASRAQPDGVHGTSMAVDLTNFEWTDDHWRNPSMENYLIYELHTGTFTPDGTFEGIIPKLDHLLGIGITAIEIMPVAQFPGQRNWGYDGVFPYAVQNSYGGAAGLMKLVDACHNKGLAVILDVVYNHLGPEGNYFSAFGPYFTGKYHTPWGDAINFDDAWCDEVRRFFIQNALQWFRDFHIDALRLDAVHAIKDFSPKHILREIKENADELMHQTGRTHHLIIEFDLNDKRFINPIEKDGYGMDAQWIDEFHHALRVTAGGGREGYYTDFNGINHLAKAYNDAYVYDGIYSPHRLKVFGTKTDNPGKQFIVFSQNHDQVGNRMLGERSSQLFSFEMQKLMAGAVMVAPFVPMLFMGEEWAESNPFLYFVSHTDQELINAVRKGRKEEFAAFHAEGEALDPQAVESFNKSKLQWHLPDRGLHAIMLNYYKALIGLRKALPALAIPDRQNLKTTVDEKANTLLLERWTNGQHVGCLMNFSDQPRFVNIEDENTLLNSANSQWGGPGADKGTIQPQSIIIYRYV